MMVTENTDLALEPVLRFPEFEGEWEQKKLGEITQYVDYRGKTPQKSEQGVFLVTAKNIKQGYIDYEVSREFILLKDYENVMRRGKPLIGDVLITTEAPLGNVASIDIEGIALAQRVIKLRGKENILQNGFLKFRLISPQFQKPLDDKSSGTTAKGIKGSELHKMAISFPTLPEQKRIASFFTVLDQKLNQLKQKKNLLAQYKKGVRQQLFSQKLRFKDDEGNEFPDWEEKKLNQITEIFDGTHQTPTYLPIGIPFYSVEHVTANNFENTKFISIDVFEKENKRVKLEKGDILMTRIGDIGTARLIDWDVKASFYVSLALIKQSSEFYSAYLNHYISTKDFQNELWQRTIHVAFPKKINLGEIGNCIVMLPVIAEQTKIANFLSAIDEKINQTQIQIKKTEQYKKGLMQKMFC
ncbi:restriction endonuclease subunit S [Mucilaginibacter arboris]|uniref:Type I restriction modification DNA specificity domain-containing protein n=1 Tax=Mucilaginibacter arboris TaxID=2682090 RepID=A0A7K1T0B6_9SPHI|nr:restriction endonuclease subunit S [Mucilaginibacter arboris]MVN22993.1 hypothetical protein [Mucilaginibacter arboris]